MTTGLEASFANRISPHRMWVKRLTYCTISALCALVIMLGEALEVQAQGQLSRSLERLSSEIVNLFPKVDGDVVKVESNQIFITLGAPDNIHEGMVLSVFRKGDEFKHPLTGVVLGRFEDDLGTLIINKVSETYSSGTVRLTKATVNVRPGDRVRITKGKIQLAIFPIKGDLPTWVSREELNERFRLALEQTGRFQVTAADNIRVYLTEKGLQADETLPQDALARMAED